MFLIISKYQCSCSLTEFCVSNFNNIILKCLKVNRNNALQNSNALKVIHQSLFHLNSHFTLICVSNADEALIK